MLKVWHQSWVHITKYVEGVTFTSHNSYHCCNYSAPCTDHSFLSLANQVTISSHQFQTIWMLVLFASSILTLSITIWKRTPCDSSSTNQYCSPTVIQSPEISVHKSFLKIIISLISLNFFIGPFLSLLPPHDPVFILLLPKCPAKPIYFWHICHYSLMKTNLVKVWTSLARH